MNNSEYEHICDICGKKFNIYEGKGLGESYLGSGMLPKTRWICIECKMKERSFDE